MALHYIAEQHDSSEDKCTMAAVMSSDFQRKVQQTLERKWADPQKAFEAGVLGALLSWDCMTLAVNHGWTANPAEKRKKVYLHIVDMFKSEASRGRSVERDDLERYLEQTISEEFNVTAEDGSVQWLARLFPVLWHDCMVKHDYTGLNQIMASRLKPVEAQRVYYEDEEESDDEEEADDEDDEEKEDAEHCCAAESGCSHEQDQHGCTAEMGCSQQQEQNGTAEEDEWTTVSSSHRSRKTRSKARNKLQRPGRDQEKESGSSAVTVDAPPATTLSETPVPAGASPDEDTEQKGKQKKKNRKKKTKHKEVTEKQEDANDTEGKGQNQGVGSDVEDRASEPAPTRATDSSADTAAPTAERLPTTSAPATDRPTEEQSKKKKKKKKHRKKTTDKSEVA
eukprot:g4229.t1